MSNKSKTELKEEIAENSVGQGLSCKIDLVLVVENMIAKNRGIGRYTRRKRRGVERPMIGRRLLSASPLGFVSSFGPEWEWLPHGGEARTKEKREERNPLLRKSKWLKRTRTFGGVVMYVVVVMKKEN